MIKQFFLSWISLSVLVAVFSLKREGEMEN